MYTIANSLYSCERLASGMLYVFLSVLVFFILGLPYSMLLFFKGGNRKSILEIIILTAVIGPLIVNYLIFSLAYAGLLSRESIFLMTFIIIFVPFLSKEVRLSTKNFCSLVYERICRIKVIFGTFTVYEVFPLSLMVSVMVITSYSAFTLTPVLRDPYAVWLFYGKKIMETGRIPLFYGNAPDISWSGNYPPLISFLAGYYFIALGQALPEAFTHVSWIYGGLTLLATFMLARELGLRKAAFMTASLLTTASLFTLELVNYGYITIAWSFYIAVACFYLVKLWHEKTLYASLMFGLSFGAALLTTYLSFIFVASLLVLMLSNVLIRRERNFLIKFKPLIIGLIGSFGILLPWSIRNYVLLQNPFYPWLYELFGGKGLDLVMMRMVPQPKYNLQQLFIDNTLLGLPNDDIGYTLLIFGLIGSIYLIWRREKNSAYVGWLTFTFFTVFLAFMSLYYGYERYLLMVAPLLAVSAGHLLNKIFSTNKRSLKTLFLVSIVIFSLPNYVYLISLIPSGAPVGETEPLSYVGHYIDSYLSPNATILTNELQLYFINREAINVYNLPEAFQAKNVTELIYSLKLHNVTHVLINANIDANVLEKTPLFRALVDYNDTFEVLLSIYPYRLYEVAYGEILP